MFTNTKPSELMAVLDAVSPVSQAAGTVSTGWVKVGNFHALMALIQTGVLGASATVDAKLQQAQDSSGANAKDITGKAITQIVKASGDNKQAIVNCRSGELDVEGGFGYVRLSITVGTAASQVGASLFGCIPRFADAAAAFDNASVVQVI